jgi:hypothetical protein
MRSFTLFSSVKIDLSKSLPAAAAKSPLLIPPVRRMHQPAIPVDVLPVEVHDSNKQLLETLRS